MKQKAREALAYRKAAKIKKIAVFRNGESFPVCPHCRETLEREYQSYCDRCGQRLKWTKYHKAKLVYV